MNDSDERTGEEPRHRLKDQAGSKALRESVLLYVERRMMKTQLEMLLRLVRLASHPTSNPQASSALSFVKGDTNLLAALNRTNKVTNAECEELIKEIEAILTEDFEK